MQKTIEELREEIQAIAKESINESWKKIMDNREEILIAFIAKYGFHPDEVILCHQGNQCWVEKKKV